jgi:hypothetical protein
MKKITQLLVLFCTWSMWTAAAYAQQNPPVMNYYNDGEFNELEYRKVLQLFGVKGDSLEKTVNRTKLSYIKMKKQGGPHDPFAMAPPPAPPPGPPPCFPDPLFVSSGSYYYAQCNSSCDYGTMTSISSMCNSSFSTLPTPSLGTGGTVPPLYSDFFENAADHFTGWCGQVSGTYNFTALRYDFNNTYTIDPTRHQIITGNGIDPIGGFKEVPSKSNYSVMIGSPFGGGIAQATKLVTRFKINTTDDQKLFGIKYAVVLQDPGSAHGQDVTPYFGIRVFVKTPSGSTYDEDCCERLAIMAKPDFCPGFKVSSVASDFYYKDWSTQIVDLSQYALGSEVIIEIAVNHCAWGVHTAYAYIDGAYPYTPQMTPVGPVLCTKSDGYLMSFTSNIFGSYIHENVSWLVEQSTGGGAYTTASASTGLIAAGYTNPLSGTIDYPSALGDVHGITTTPTMQLVTYKFWFPPPTIFPTTYRVTLSVGKDSPCPPVMQQEVFTITDCNPIHIACDECIKSFAPLPGKKYVLSAWVREDLQLPYNGSGGMSVTSYTGPAVYIKLNGIGTELPAMLANGPIIDGWQKLEYEFTIPEGTSSIEVRLENDGTDAAYFDDVRVFPSDGQMKSYVYDPVNLRLTGELDENNYATFYEYDLEGKLIRVKKETERGVKTVKEAFYNLRKQN